VKRSFNTIRRWQRQGMPTRLIDGQYYVEVETAFTWKRMKLADNPVWQKKLRKMIKDQETDTPK